VEDEEMKQIKAKGIKSQMLPFWGEANALSLVASLRSSLCAQTFATRSKKGEKDF
jgi:hypothetical protein